MVIDICLIVGGIMLAGKTIRIITVGQEADLDVHSFFQQHVDTADTSLNTRSVTVVKYGDIICKTMNKPDLLRS